MDQLLTYSVNLVGTSISGTTYTDTVTVNGGSISPITRSDSNAGAYHSFSGISPVTNGVIEIRIDNSAFNPNPVVNALTLEVEGGPGGGGGVADWYAAHSLTGDDAHPEADTNEDKIQNGICYALGIHPVDGLSPAQQGEQNPLPRAVEAPDGSDWGLSLLVPAAPPEDVTYIIEQNCDPGTQSWVEVSRKQGSGAWSGTAVVSEGTAMNGSVPVTINGTVDPAVVSICLLRLRVEIGTP